MLLTQALLKYARIQGCAKVSWPKVCVRIKYQKKVLSCSPIEEVLDLTLAIMRWSSQDMRTSCCQIPTTPQVINSAKWCKTFQTLLIQTVLDS